MTALKLAWLELRRFRGPLRKLVLPLLCLIPLLYGAMYLWANWDPYGKLDQIPVAVVNQDQLAHTDQGQRVDAGQQVISQLKAAQTFQWDFVDAEQAQKGLAEGNYFFTITIPPDFSSKLATASNPNPEQAGIDIQLNDANNYIAGIMTEVVQPQLQEQINAAAHAAYVRGIYGELSGVRDQLATASNGAHRLVNATEVAQQGSDALASGSTALHTGAGQVTEGAGQLSEATAQIAGLTNRINNAVAERLPAAASGLVDTANVVAQGVGGVHAGTSQVSQATSRGVADLTELVNAHPELAGDPIVVRAQHNASRLDATAGRVDGAAATAQRNADHALAAAQGIQRNVGTIQQQVRDANVPLRLIDSGTHAIAGGAGTVTEGLGALEQGSGSLRSAADQAGGAASDLAGTVDSTRSQIPPTNPDQVARTAEVLSSPVNIDRDNMNPAGSYGRGFAPFFFGIALWVFGLFAYLLLRPVNLRALAGRVRAATLAIAGWLPAAALGIVGALVLYGVVTFGLGLDPVRVGSTILLLVLGAGTFVAIDHFLRTALGAPGDVLSLVLLILQLTSSGGLYPMPTTPGLFQALNPLLPMTYLIDGLRATISGGLTSHLVRDFAVLGGFLVLFLALTSLVLRRQRVWTVARLHPDVEL